MFKRSGTIRELDVNDIPSYMRELDKLEDIYFGKEKLENPRDEFNAKRLFEFIHKLNPPKEPSLHIPYEYLIELADVAPEKNKLDFVIQKLLETKHITEVNEKIKKEVERKFNYANNWVGDFVKHEKIKVQLTDGERSAIEKLIEEIKKENEGEKLQYKIFEIAKSKGIKPIRFFQLLYKIILNEERGPRLGPYIIDRGKEEIIKMFEKSLK